MTGKIAAIKALRMVFGIGLREAKYIVDGERLLTEFVDVNAFSDAALLVPVCQRYHYHDAPPVTTRRIEESELDEYFSARMASERALNAERRAIRKSELTHEVTRLVKQRLLG